VRTGPVLMRGRLPSFVYRIVRPVMVALLSSA
jgi:hypothetical protein